MLCSWPLWCTGACVEINTHFEYLDPMIYSVISVNIYIQRAFRCGRMLFGTPVTGPPPGYQSIQVSLHYFTWCVVHTM